MARAAARESRCRPAKCDWMCEEGQVGAGRACDRAEAEMDRPEEQADKGRAERGRSPRRDRHDGPRAEGTRVAPRSGFTARRSSAITALRDRSHPRRDCLIKSTIRGPQREATSSLDRHDPAVPGRCDRVPAGPRLTFAAVWPQHFVSGEDDQVGVRRDDVLRRELRVAGAVLVGRVGDVAQSEQFEHLAAERRRGRRVVVGAELLVDAQIGVLRHGRRDRRDPLLHRPTVGRRSGVPGCLAEVLDLSIGVGEARCRRLEECRDIELRRAP